MIELELQLFGYSSVVKTGCKEWNFYGWNRSNILFFFFVTVLIRFLVCLILSCVVYNLCYDIRMKYTVPALEDSSCYSSPDTELLGNYLSGELDYSNNVRHNSVLQSQNSCKSFVSDNENLGYQENSIEDDNLCCVLS